MSAGTLPLVPLDDEKLPIKMLNDRVLVRIPTGEGERRSTGGIVIPATAQISKRLVWAEVVASISASSNTPASISRGCSALVS